MSTFYLLPSRAVLGDYLAPLLEKALPGLAWRAAGPDAFAEALLAVLQEQTGVYVIFQEDALAEAPTAEILTDQYGAEPADEIIELRLNQQSDELVARRRRVEPPRAA